MIAENVEITQESILGKLEKAFETRVHNIDEALSEAEEALEQSQTLRDGRLMAWANTYLAYFNMIKSNHTLSFKHADKAISYFENENDKEGLALAYFSIGSSKYKTDNYHLALKYLTESFQLYQSINDRLGQSRTLKAIGSVYEFFEEYEKAEGTYQKCIDISKEIGDKNGMSNAMNPLSGIYIRKGKIDEALSLIKRSINLKKQTNDIRGLGFAYYGLGKVYLASKKYDLAKKYLTMSYDTHSKMNELVGAMMTLNKQGILHYENHDFTNARRKLKACIKMGKQSKHFLITHKSYWLLYKICKEENDYKAALEYLELHKIHKDKVINKETRNVISSIQSISRLELLEKETKWQKEINSKVERKNKELDSFVYKVSHDLRGPISSLMGLFELVKHEVRDPKAVEYFEIYNKQINRLNGILMDFLDLIQIKEKEVQIEKIDFDQIIKECLNSFQYHENFNVIDFAIRIKNSVSFSSDKSAITSIIQNLLENSIKYANLNKSPFVKVHIHEIDQSIVIKVSDNGLGIKKDDKKKIFDMFYRSHPNINGTGLGLYIVKSAIEKLKGEVSVKSKIGEGTTIQATLPKAI